MRLHFEDHAGFQRGVLHVAAACSAVAGLAAAAGSEALRPTAVVLGAAVATLALAFGHARLVLDPVADALSRAAVDADDDTRRLLARTARARRTLSRGGTAEAARALGDAGTSASLAVAALATRRQDLARELERATPADAASSLDELGARRAAARDELAREAYARAEAALRERAARGESIARVVERLDARLAAAVAELESAAFALATRAPNEPGGGSPALLAAACERLRAANADLGAEAEALAELGAV
jgi:hypothetical protein